MNPTPRDWRKPPKHLTDPAALDWQLTILLQARYEKTLQELAGARFLDEGQKAAVKASNEKRIAALEQKLQALEVIG